MWQTIVTEGCIQAGNLISKVITEGASGNNVSIAFSGTKNDRRNGILSTAPCPLLPGFFDSTRT